VTAVEQLLGVARSQIGTVEAGDGSNPYGRAYGMDRVAWCAEFVWWCFTTAGLGSLIPKTAYTPTFFGWFEQHGQAPNDLAPGDVIFFDWGLGGLVTPGREGLIDHVGIVEARLPDGRVQTIEGNTTPPTGTGNQGHGGGVWRRARAMSCVAGWGRPAYPGAAPVVTPPAFDPNTLPTLAKGQTSPHVALFQKASNDAPWSPPLPLLPVTGFYGDQTAAVVKAAQAQRGVTGPDANGETIGPRTKAAFAAFGLRW
jgi:peptidoglycan hydrolase-like protein with peptidoglycan-binding domain